MISRRIIRIKALQVLFAYFKGENDSILKAENELFHSITRAYDLYFYLLLLLVELRDHANNRLELARQKLVPSHDDLNPNTRFVENRVIKLIESNPIIQEYWKKSKLSWVNYPELIKKLYQKVSASEYFEAYMNSEANDFVSDRQLLVSILNRELDEFEDLEQCLEEQSLYWFNDVDFIAGMVGKTVKKLTNESTSRFAIPEMLKDIDDEEFARKLVRKTILNHPQNVKLIDQFTVNWELERIASMDILIMEMAITEITEFPTIPVRVSFNEYIELSKYYSTEQSSTFVNGVLDKLIAQLRSENRINKQGRGLLGEEDGNDDN